MRSKKLTKLFLTAVKFYRHFVNSACFARAGSLAFSTTLSLVPLIVVSVGALSLLPFSGQWQSNIQDFIFDNFIASSGTIIQQYLTEFVTNVNKLSWYSIIFLIITAIDILFSIENSLNAIWKTHIGRHWLKAISLYLFILICAPTLFFLSLATTFAVINSYIPHWVFAFIPMELIKISPILLSVIIFLLIFKIIPHCYVKWSCAFGGAFVAAILFESAKIIFAWYVQAFPTYRIIYGAIAALPIFLLWIYICWVIVLVGAVTSYMLQQKE